MKKFFTNVPLQKKNQELKSYVYLDSEGKLQTDIPTAFPIINVMRKFLTAGDSFEVVVIVPAGDVAEVTGRNFARMQEEIETVCAQIGCRCAAVHRVTPADGQDVEVQLDLFRQLIAFAADGDDLYMDMTYGTKPMSAVLTMAVQYVYRVLNDTTIGCICYGEVIRNENEPDIPNIYDMTALTMMDEVVRMLAEQKIREPGALIDMILDG